MAMRFLCKVQGEDEPKVLRLNKSRVKCGETDIFPNAPDMNRVEALKLIRKHFIVVQGEKD